MTSDMANNESQVIVPPDELAKRVGGSAGDKFIAQGKLMKQCILQSLPENYTFENKRILDYGCGVGRALLHFGEEAQNAKFYGTDIHKPSVDFLAQNTRDFHLFQNEEIPPLAFLDNYFDMIYCISVFTHLVDTWEAWINELHRVLKPGGLAVVTYWYQTAYERMIKKPFSKEKKGMSVFFKDRPWDKGGPDVYHSNEWILKNWGKRFKIDYIFEDGMMNWQSIALLQKNDSALPQDPQQTKIIRPYLYKTYIDGFHGSLAYNKFPGKSWQTLHGVIVTNNIEIIGWFASKYGPIEHFDCSIDNEEIPFELEKLERNDVKSLYPDFPDKGILGVKIKIDLKDCEPGYHDLSVFATDSKNNKKEQKVVFLKTDESR